MTVLTALPRPCPLHPFPRRGGGNRLRPGGSMCRTTSENLMRSSAITRPTLVPDRIFTGADLLYYNRLEQVFFPHPLPALQILPSQE